LKTRSAAEPVAPDESLGAAPFAHRGLTYPFGRSAPDEGALAEVAEGVGWSRLPVPGSLGHINVWLLDDGAELVVADTGLAIGAARAAWAALLEGPLAGRELTRIVVTHFHPDHIGLAGWLAARNGARLWMTRGEWTLARMLAADVRDAPPDEALAFWRAAGWEAPRIAAEAEKGWGRFAAMVSPIPASYGRLRDGDTVRIGARDWRVVVGSGHSPEHACLVDFEGRLMIAGDQVLPRITSNVSLSLSEPEADPLGEWLDSIARLKRLPDDLTVLPAHGLPFTGLHARLDALDAGHRGRLDALHAHLAEPRRAVDCFAVLFGRRIDDGILGMATGEALAHLRRLEVEGRAAREVRDGVWWFCAA
jgi:glyoxylase-like metal-dependent hydrolase (beta-lactamase superfamily II)